MSHVCMHYYIIIKIFYNFIQKSSAKIKFCLDEKNHIVFFTFPPIKKKKIIMSRILVANLLYNCKCPSVC